MHSSNFTDRHFKLFGRAFRVRTWSVINCTRHLAIFLSDNVLLVMFLVVMVSRHVEEKCMMIVMMIPLLMHISILHNFLELLAICRRLLIFMFLRVFQCLRGKLNFRNKFKDLRWEKVREWFFSCDWREISRNGYWRIPKEFVENFDSSFHPLIIDMKPVACYISHSLGQSF